MLTVFAISGSQYRKTNKNKQLNRYTDRQTKNMQANSRFICTRFLTKCTRANNQAESMTI